MRRPTGGAVWNLRGPAGGHARRVGVQPEEVQAQVTGPGFSESTVTAVATTTTYGRPGVHSAGLPDKVSEDRAAPFGYRRLA
jgi:hypothetical protein